ncbi:MAG: hypothetical protein M3Q45_14165 [Chloroflexota bacterium]|nr:hypothetical protein [Chloroflexota bacterium]
MARITITKDNLLSRAALKTQLEQMAMHSSPTSDLMHLLRDLFIFEEKYNLASDVFYARFMRGEMGDDLPLIQWAGHYELYLEVKHTIDSWVVQTAVTA